MKTPRILFAGNKTTRFAAEMFGKYFGEKQVAVEVRVREDLTPETLADAAWEWDASVVRAELDLGHEWLAGLAVQPLSVSRNQAADVFVRSGKTWSPDLLIEPAFRDNLVKRGHHLDLRASAYVVGQGLCARVITGVVLSLGYRQAFMVGPDAAELASHRGVLESIFVGSRVEVIREEALTLQTTGASLLVNTLDLEGRSELAADLAYFNFMNPGGLVVDLDGGRDERPVLTEAERAGLRTIPAHEIAAAREWRLAELCGLGNAGSAADFARFWDEHKNASSVQ